MLAYTHMQGMFLVRPDINHSTDINSFFWVHILIYVMPIAIESTGGEARGGWFWFGSYDKVGLRGVTTFH